MESMTPPVRRLRDVETASQMMRRYYGLTKETMRAMAGYLSTMCDWSAKKMLARHIWFDAMHADMLRARTLELRYPRVDVDQESDKHLIACLRQLPNASSDRVFLMLVYRVIKPALRSALLTYCQETDPLDDAPSHVYLNRIMHELDDQLREAELVLAQWWPAQEAGEPIGQIVTACEHLEARLAACGGIHGPDADPGSYTADTPYILPNEGGRYSGWSPAVMQVPPRDPRNTLEHRLWIAIDHANEVWASETAAALIWAYPDMPWHLYHQAARWTYDEMRHAMMGEQRLLDMGFELGIDVPMVPDHWRVFRSRGVQELLLLVHGLEKKGPLHKSRLKQALSAVDDLTGAQDCDYDWADEANHISFGLAWIKALQPDWNKETIMRRTEEIVDEWTAWIQNKHASGEHGYDGFMARISAKISQQEGD